MKLLFFKIFWPVVTLIIIISSTAYLTDSYKDALHKAKEDAAQAKLEFAFSIEDVLARERIAVSRLSEVSTLHQREIKNEKNRFNNYVSGIRNGTVRVSVPVTHCTSVSPISDSALTRPTETRAELTSEAAASLAAIASEGNQAILGLNACIDQYNAVRDAFNHAKSKSNNRANNVQAQ